MRNIFASQRMMAGTTVAALLLGVCASASGQTPNGAGKPRAADEIALYKAPDRQQFLEACARDEGQVSVIAGEFGDTVITPLTRAFNKIYPFIKVGAIRLDEPQMVTRVLQEARANRRMIDVLDNGPSSFGTLRKAGLLTPFYTPFVDQYKPEEISPDGYYVGVRETVLAPVYNTSLLPKELVPRNWDDLLNPGLKGKMAIADDDVLSKLIRGNIEVRGEAAAMKYLEALSKQDIRVYHVSTRGIVDLIAGGEAPMAMTALPIHAEAAKAKGAPVEWSRIEPRFAWTNAMARMKDAPHPCAAGLWTDFMLDPQQGQVGLASVGYLPAAHNTPSQYREITATSLHYVDQIWMSDHAEDLQNLRDKYFLQK